MSATTTIATLPQRLDRNRAASTLSQDAGINQVSRLTYHSTAIEGSTLTQAQSKKSIQNKPHLGGSAQRRLASRRQPIGRNTNLVPAGKAFVKKPRQHWFETAVIPILCFENPSQ